MIRDPLIFIRHIEDSVDAIEKFSENLSKESFKNDRLKQSAIVREIEIIGEAVKNIPSSFKEKHKEVEWKKIAAMRDKLIHHYFGIDINTIWDVVEYDLPNLKNQIKAIRKGFESKEDKL